MSLKSVAERAAHSLGAGGWIRYAKRHRVRILMYHRFAESELPALEAQCAHLRRYYQPISLSELAEAARTGRTLPANSLAITVDDGYRDFALAFPIFQKHGLKVTLYVVSEFAAGGLWLWPDQLLYLLNHSPMTQAELPIPGGTYSLDLSNRYAAWNPLAQKMIGMRNEERLALLGALPMLLGIELPQAAPEFFSALSWSELRAMAAEGLDIGAHTVTHPILSSIETEAGLEKEIRGSKKRIEEATGVSVRHFCYPNGKRADVSAAAIAQAEAAGFETAVLAEPGLAGRESALYELKRVGVDPSYSPLYFERCVAGYRM